MNEDNVKATCRLMNVDTPSRNGTIFPQDTIKNTFCQISSEEYYDRINQIKEIAKEKQSNHSSWEIVVDSLAIKPCPTQLPTQDPFMVEAERKSFNPIYLFPRQYGRMTSIEAMILHRHGQFFNNHIIKLSKESLLNEYRKFIEENKYGRVKLGSRQISIPRIQRSKSNRNNIKHDTRRFLNGMGK